MGAVLVVDDDDDICDLVALKLRLEGHQVSTANSIETGWELATSQRRDLFIVDWALPEGTEGELCERLRTHSWYLRTPIIVLTAHVGAEVREATIASGATEYLAKPFSPRELALRVEQLTTD